MAYPIITMFNQFVLSCANEVLSSICYSCANVAQVNAMLRELFRQMTFQVRNCLPTYVVFLRVNMVSKTNQTTINLLYKKTTTKHTKIFRKCVSVTRQILAREVIFHWPSIPREGKYSTTISKHFPHCFLYAIISLPDTHQTGKPLRVINKSLRSSTFSDGGLYVLSSKAWKCSIAGRSNIDKGLQ